MPHVCFPTLISLNTEGEFHVLFYQMLFLILPPFAILGLFIAWVPLFQQLDPNGLPNQQHQLHCSCIKTFCNPWPAPEGHCSHWTCNKVLRKLFEIYSNSVGPSQTQTTPNPDPCCYLPQAIHAWNYARGWLLLLIWIFASTICWS